MSGSEKKQTPAEQQAHMHQTIVFASCIGLNELAHRSDQFGTRLYYRMLADMQRKEAVRLGAVITEVDQEVICQIGTKPWIKIYAKDVENMRRALAAWDATHGTVADKQVAAAAVAIEPTGAEEQ